MQHVELAALVVALVLGTGGLAAQEAAAPASAPPYVGAEACRSCHDALYKAWAGTKHARALERLATADRDGGRCIQCHVTGSPELIAAEGNRPSLPGVQCEACHGPGASHVEAARGGATTSGSVVRTPPEQTCLRCHNPQSPHYKPFLYGAMKAFVHRVPSSSGRPN